MSFLRVLSASLAAVLLLTAPAARLAFAQDTSGPVQGTQAERFRLAERYLRGGQTGKAIALLEDLRAENPGTPVFYQKLEEAYESQKRYDDAIALVEREMAQRGRSARLVAEKARLQYLGGDEQTAFATWDAAVAAAPGERQTYQVVQSILTDARLFRQAAEVIRRGREALGEPAAFRLQLAYLYSLTSQHEQAITEYLALLKEEPKRLRFVERRLGRFIEQEEALQESIAATSRAVRAEPLNRAYRELMGWLYLEAGEHRKALRAYRAIDRLEGEDGRVLFSFAGKAADAGAYAVALDAYDRILERYPDAPVAPEALRGRGQMLERWAGEQSGDAADEHYEEALAAYRDFLDEYPQHQAYPSVLRAVGRLQQDVLFELDAAEQTLQEVIDRYASTRAADLARYDLGRLQVMRGDLTDARLAFSRLVERLRTGDLAEQARYEQALLHFYQGEFDAASTLLDAVGNNTSTDVSNDGIGLGVLLAERKAARDTTGQALALYARVRLRRRQRRPDDALALIDTLLTQHGAHPVADDARFLKAQVLAENGSAEDAAAAYAQVALAHPRSALADRSLFEAARLQENALDDPAAALETYTRLLSDYPGSLHVPDARARIRALRSEVSDEEEAEEPPS